MARSHAHIQPDTASDPGFAGTDIIVQMEHNPHFVANGADSYRGTAEVSTTGTEGSPESIDIGNDYKALKWDTPGTYDLVLDSDITAEVLVVGGGGGGGHGQNMDEGGGGGGAGGLIYRASMVIAAGTHTDFIVVGAAGAANTQGNDSKAGSMIAYGGGHGIDNGCLSLPNANGGSGGGGSGCEHGRSGANATQDSNNGGTGYGNNGGYSAHRHGGGGGGGAGGPGGSNNGCSGGYGGPTKQYTITGTLQAYAGGGTGGHGCKNHGTGLAGALSPTPGGGGGGSGAHDGNSPGTGGIDGIVIIKFNKFVASGDIQNASMRECHTDHWKYAHALNQSDPKTGLTPITVGHASKFMESNIYATGVKVYGESWYGGRYWNYHRSDPYDWADDGRVYVKCWHGDGVTPSGWKVGITERTGDTYTEEDADVHSGGPSKRWWTSGSKRNFEYVTMNGSGNYIEIGELGHGHGRPKPHSGSGIRYHKDYESNSDISVYVAVFNSSALDVSPGSSNADVDLWISHASWVWVEIGQSGRSGYGMGGVADRGYAAVKFHDGTAWGSWVLPGEDYQRYAFAWNPTRDETQASGNRFAQITPYSSATPTV